MLHSRSGELARYFFAHFFVEACHIPPAFSQSACVRYWLKSLDEPLLPGLADGDPVLPEGLADGAEEPDPDVPVDVPLPEPVAPVVPDGVEPAPPVAPPLPLLPAAASAGVSIMTPTIREARSLVMSMPPYDVTFSSAAWAITGPTTSS